jgi:hypothetical protein
MPRGIGLTYDGMRRCQRLPELRTPLIPRDIRGMHQIPYLCGTQDLLAKRAPMSPRPSHVGDALTSAHDGMS